MCRGAVATASEQKPHHDRVPQFAVCATVVLDASPLLDEPELVVERNCRIVVREDVEAELVQALVTRSIDRRGHEGGANASAAPPPLDEHCEIANAETALRDVDHSDERAARNSDETTTARDRELLRVCIDVDRRFRRNAIALLRDRGEQLRHLPRVLRARRSHLEVDHNAILPSAAYAEGASRSGAGLAPTGRGSPTSGLGGVEPPRAQ